MKVDVERYQREEVWPVRLTAVHVASDALIHKLNHLHAKPGLYPLYYVAYKRWQRAAYEIAKKIHEKNPFDIVHHINILGYREPGYMWSLGIPFFWGPLTGAPQVPWTFLNEYGLLQRLRWSLRNLLNRRQIRGSKRCSKAAAAAFRIWCVSEEDRIMVEDWGFHAEHMLETGASESMQAHIPAVRESNQPLKLVWSGLFLGIKSLPLVLRAMKRLPADVNVTLDVLGSGPEEKLWLRETESLGLESKVTFHGFLRKDEAMAVMRKAHVLVHSSVKEGTPHVVLEALSMGIPVVCHNACGMGTAVTDQCGVLIPLRDPKTSERGFASAITELYQNPLSLKTLALGATERARELSWSHIVNRISEAYNMINR